MNPSKSVPHLALLLQMRQPLLHGAHVPRQPIDVLLLHLPFVLVLLQIGQALLDGLGVGQVFGDESAEAVVAGLGLLRGLLEDLAPLGDVDRDLVFQLGLEFGVKVSYGCAGHVLDVLGDARNVTPDGAFVGVDLGLVLGFGAFVTLVLTKFLRQSVAKFLLGKRGLWDVFRATAGAAICV